MKATRSRQIVLVAALLALGALAVGAAVAAVVSQEVLFPPSGNSGPANIRIVHTIADDFDSGWHTHPGPAIVQVQDGAFKIYQGSCEPVVVQGGETFIEIPNVAVRAVSKGRVEWTTTLVIPGPFNGSAAPPAQTNLTTDPCA